MRNMRRVAKKLLACVMILILMMPMSAVAYDDYNTKEVGVEWVQSYGPCGLGNLYATKSDAESFYNALGNKGWTRRYNWGNADAWEKDYEKASLGGWDTIAEGGADTVDFAYFSGHGSPNAFWFGTNHDGDGYLPCRVDRTEASWGETDLDWITISVCQVLQFSYGGQSVFQRWGPRFRGLHQILSYDTISYDLAMGGKFAYYMTRPWYLGGAKKIKDAWFQANRDIQPSSVWSAVLSTDKGWNDYLPGYGGQGADGGYYLFWQKVQS